LRRRLTSLRHRVISGTGRRRHGPEVVTQVLGIVYRAISGHLIRKTGLTRASAVTGAGPE
jgi:hypothetical protein